ncbi:MAG: hypothetical protein EWM50_05495 [Gottschalkiaceae bacterium]|nr:MAG: hypothetical protein EWM50_05495 [Gottschalkiaceae bacterium]
MITTSDKIVNDTYIFIPFYMKANSKELPNIVAPPEISKFIDEVTSTSLYECNKRISVELQRKYLGRHKFVVMDDNYDEPVGTCDVDLVLTSHYNSNLHILCILFIQNECCITQIEDQASSKNLRIVDETSKSGETISMYMDKHYNLVQCGDEKCLICLSKKPEDELELHCMLAAEAYNSVHIDYKVKSDDIKKAANTNLAEYDFYELYASFNSIVYISDEIGDDFTANLDTEAAIIFICEITLFQNAAISRTNARIVNKLSDDVDVSLNSIEKLYAEFGKTIIFWDKNIYNYSLAQNLADNISLAFKNDKLLSDYYRNQNHLEHIVELKNSISGAREGKILNLLALILGTSEIIQLVKSLVGFIQTGNIMLIKVAITSASFTVLVIVFIAVLRMRKKKKISKTYVF